MFDGLWKTARLAEVAAGRAPFSSIGSLGEFAAACYGGLQPLGLVTGIAVEVDRNYGAGVYIRPGVVHEGSLWGARWGIGVDHALERLRDQAVLIGANLVVGIALEVERSRIPGQQEHAIKFQLAGSAMRAGDRGRSTDLVLSNLSAEEHVLLGQAGYRPAGVCVAAAKYNAGMTTRSARIARRGASRVGRLLGSTRAQPQALPDISDTVSGARHAIVKALAFQARRLRADGIVNTAITIDMTPPEATWLNAQYTLTATAIATAITRERTATITPHTTLRLNDQPRRP